MNKQLKNIEVCHLKNAYFNVINCYYINNNCNLL